jgi:hypothetical protein
MTEGELLSDCLGRLNRIGVEYYLTGSMASNYWGIPRTTHDLDFVIRMSPSAIKPLVEAFGDDYYIDEAAVASAFAPPFQFNAIDTRSALKIDFWLPKPAPFDREMLSRRMAVTIAGVPAWIATAEDVILHKLIWNQISPSNRQLVDAAGIFAVQGERLDRVYMQKWAEDLGVEHVLAQLFLGQIRPKNT